MRRSFPTLTVSLISICFVTSLMSNFGSLTEVLQPLFISSSPQLGFQEIMSGQVWRLITPIFIHFNLLHIVFNMLWLWDLGKLLESTRGTWYFGFFILVTGVLSNIAQYVLEGLPYFGGMSGVVYGLLGYLWMQGKFNPRFGYVLHQPIVYMMLVWFALCWTGLFGPIANWAHTAGLIIGVIWGYLERGGIKRQPLTEI